MTDLTNSASSSDVAARLRAIDGVVQIFPRQPIVEVLRAVADRPPILVELESDGVQTKVGARIGIERSQPITAVIDRVADTLPAALGDRPLQIEIEIAYIA